MIPQIMKLNSLTKQIEIFDTSSDFYQTFGLSLMCDENEKKNYVWQMNDKNPEFFVHIIYKNSLFEFFKNFISKDKLKVIQI